MQRMVYLWNEAWPCNEVYYIFMPRRKLNIRWHENPNKKSREEIIKLNTRGNVYSAEYETRKRIYK